MPRDITIGVGVAAIQDGRLLVGKRKTGAGKGLFALPGGHIEKGEPFVYSAIRECYEETGLLILPYPADGIRWDFHTEERIFGEKHTVTIYVAGEVIAGTLGNPEPEKHEDWKWLKLDDVEDNPSLSWVPVGKLKHYRTPLGL